MKHMLHKARDVKVYFEVNLTLKTVTIHVESIDTLILDQLITEVILENVNEELNGQLPLLKNLSGFSIQLLFDNKVKFKEERIERDFEPRLPTLVISLLDA